MIDPLLPSIVWMPGMTFTEFRYRAARVAVKHYKSIAGAARALGISRQTMHTLYGQATAWAEVHDPKLIEETS